MVFEQPFTRIGRETDKIPVHISFRIIQLFSEGLYQSPHKAIEELVVNSYDADARNVHVILSPDRAADDSFIAVIDDGSGMDAVDLRQHWLIGDSNKRDPAVHLQRKQIGKFGIGKLATFVLAHKLTHVTKKGGKFYAVTMNFGAIPEGHGRGLQPTENEVVQLPLRELTEDEARESLAPLLVGKKEGYRALRLFGARAKPTWTVSLLSDLKEMAKDIQKGRLEWVLRTAMPLQDDFRVFLDGDVLPPAIAGSKNLLKRWTFGKDLPALADPAPRELEPTEDEAAVDGIMRYGLTHPALGRICGYAEVYDDLLTEGKAAELGRSHGIFVYVRKRLINLDDALFGLRALRHGTFARFRAVIHVDRLDEELRSSRETVRDGPLASTARNILHAVFNVARVWLEEHDATENAGPLAARRISESPGDLTGRPIFNLVAAALEGKICPRHFEIPTLDSVELQGAFLRDLKARMDSDSALVSSLELVERGPDCAIVTFDVASATLKLNALHPFVAANRDDYEKRRETLGLLAMADALTEAYLFQAGVDPADIHDCLARRDELLRQFARSLPRTAATVARALEDASTNNADLERELVACFDSMGFQSVHLGGPDRPDGRADAYLGATRGGPSSYSVSLEAKSKQKPDGIVQAKDIGVSRVARHRDGLGCDHAVVVAPDFPTGDGEDSALVREVRADHEACQQRAARGEGKAATISLIRINDLSRLVRLVSAKCIGLNRIRELFISCVTPAEAKSWVDGVEAEKGPSFQFHAILQTIWEEQQEVPRSTVELSAVCTALRLKRNVHMDQAELQRICQALACLAPTIVTVRQRHVELRQRPDKVIAAAAESLSKLPESEQRGSPFRMES